jgi:hypothetical protein
MVLINCKEGLKEISSKAEICPKCGIKLKKKSYIYYVILLGLLTSLSLRNLNTQTMI